MSDGNLDPYAVLGVSRGATDAHLKLAHRHLARRFHPDRTAGSESERRMVEINAAWAILRDPALRAEWDREHPFSVQEAIEPARPHVTTSHADTPGGPVAWRRGPAGEGAAGPPPGRPAGSVLTFGRHIGWSIGEIARVDVGYLRWLVERPEGAALRAEIEQVLGPNPQPGTGTQASAGNGGFSRFFGRR